ncbi:hypothetical protein ACW9IB_21715 [Pseudomonas sp. SDO524_S393]
MPTLTKKQIAAAQGRSLKAMSNKLLKMAEAWADVDEYNANILGETSEQLLKVHADLLETVDEGV